MFTQVSIVALLAVFAQSALAATCSRTYTIMAGDYCDMISRAQKVSTYQLAALNPSLINQGCTNLTPGESICLGVTGEDCSTTQVVQSGDTCTSIAAQNGLNMTILTLNNPQLDSACHIYVGQVLCTAQTVQVPGIPPSGITISMGGSTPVSTVIPPQSTPPAVAASTPAPPAITPAPAPPAPPPAANAANAVDTSTPAPAPAPTDNGSNDDNLPFCDEL